MPQPSRHPERRAKGPRSGPEMLRSKLSLTLLAAIALGLVACGGASAPASSQATASAVASGSAASAGEKPEKAKISIARSAQGGSFIPIMIAKEAGYFAKYGLDAELLLVA